MATEQQFNTGMEQLGKDLLNIKSQMAEHMKAQQEELKKHGKTTEELGSKMDKVNEAWTKTEKDIFDLKQSFAENGDNAHIIQGPASAKSIARAFIESSEYKNFVSQGGRSTQNYDLVRASMKNYSQDAIDRGHVQGSEAFLIKGSFGSPLMMPKNMETKDMTSDNVGDLVDTYRWQQVVQDPQRMPVVQDLIPRVPVSSNAVEYPPRS